MQHKYITVTTLKKLNACNEGIVDFCEELQKRNRKRVSVDECVRIAIDIDRHVGFLVAKFAKYLTDRFTCDWNKLNGEKWVYLLIIQPQFSVHCDWSKLSGWDWWMLLKYQPQFIEYYNFDKLDDHSIWAKLVNENEKRNKYDFRK